MTSTGTPLSSLHGALLVNKHAGVSSFGIIELLQRSLTEATGVKRRDLPKMGHGGTLDPFATGMLVICVGDAVKLSRYFLDSEKTYTGLIRFGETTLPGDPTHPISETSSHLPATREEIQAQADGFTRGVYSQLPPMFSAKKQGGKPLYELARQGIEVEREPRDCRLSEFSIHDYADRRSRFRVRCSAGTYIRTLSQDLGRALGTVAMLDELHRATSGSFDESLSLGCEEIARLAPQGQWDQLRAWIPFDRMLEGYAPAVDIAPEDALMLLQGKQHVLRDLPLPADGCWAALYSARRLTAVARRDSPTGEWGLERVFVREG